MPGALTTIEILDKDGNAKTMRVWDESGTGVGPFQFVKIVAKADGTAIDPAQDGVDGTDITPPTGGSGIRGWLSGIFEKLTRPNDGSGTAASKHHLTVGGSDGTNLRPLSMNASGNLMVGAEGTKITSAALASGGVGLLGWITHIAYYVQVLYSNSVFGAATVIAHNQVSIGTTATLIAAARTSRNSILIQNLSATEVWLGGAGVTPGNGILLSGVKGASVNIEGAAAIYGIVASGSQLVAFMEAY